MATPRFGKPYIWATWLAKVMDGTNPCIWAASFMAHFKYDKIEDPSFDSAAYAAEHARATNAYAAQLRAKGWTCRLEDENDFGLDGEKAILAGKPDIVAFKGKEILIPDIKGGKKMDWHWWQVLIYMAAFPLH